MGFKTMKMKVGGAPLKEDIERVRAVRAEVGPDVDFGIDANNAWDYPTALKMARCCEEENVLFFEEPLSSDFLQDCVRLAANTDVPIAGYETKLTRYGMRDFIVNDAVDIVQVDAIWTGGISEARRVGILAGEMCIRDSPKREKFLGWKKVLKTAWKTLPALFLSLIHI